MPIISIQNITNDITLGIWKITETKATLVNLLGSHLIDPSKPQNQAENVGVHWFASRVLLQHLFDANRIEIHKNENNKPTLFIDHEKYFISISHSYEYVGIMFSKTHEVGFDIERVDERIRKVSHKFLNENEQVFAIGKLIKTIIWSAKESVYKLYSNSTLNFKTNIEMHLFEPKQKGIFNCFINKNDIFKEVAIHYFQLDNYVFTYCF